MAEQRTQPRQVPPLLGPGGPGGPGAGLGSGQKPRDARGTLRRIWGYLRHQKQGLAFVFLMSALSTGLGLLGPWLMGMAIDDYIMAGDLVGLARIAWLMLIVYLLTSLTTWLQTYAMAAVAQQAVHAIRRDLFARLQTLSLRFFDQRPHGELMSRLTNDVENISNVLTEGVTQFFASILMLVGVAAMMLALNVRLAAVSLVTIPLMVSLTSWVARRTRSGFRAQQRTLGELNGLIEETVTGERVVKAYGQEQATLDAFRKANQAYRDAAIHAQTYALILGPMTNFVNNVGYAVVACAGGWMALLGWVTVGTIAAFVNYARQFGRPLNQIANLYNAIQSAIAGAERVFEVLDEVPEITDAPGAIALSQIRGEVIFEDVSFSYDGKTPTLKGVSLHARPGQVVALVGPTGAGKTTIVNLLTRFYDVDSGRITIDGHDIRHIQVDTLRRHLGIVLQDTFLFSGTVMENIRYGRLDATDEEVYQAARLANADHFIRSLPQGYQTLLSERGSNLSQGQRQLLAIARAILAAPQILILDEATSSVDTRTELQIQEAFLRLMQGRTSFVIAHRLSTIRNADQILVIRDGQVVERGRHEELLARRGFYHQLYTSQFHFVLPEHPYSPA
ncbi:ABC transporter ATP-binding protein/permease [Litorilinea aerophila]|uniref:ABC transporter ATP-binding protein n=1 Tax=Litorilinea aerophila TaxID=1204385 RepID=A0A540VFY1_9CHLR|nr:ABC transporter ATP-binding protein [Litorilinea aerophila]MCC9076673.1 ABC transporter ATP-binding protein/permease [Litorilinea aerophila]GIV77711.1 MAG: multidrug ABC transporter ATP-binding protein [Litorilinea sp.]